LITWRFCIFAPSSNATSGRLTVRFVFLLELPVSDTSSRRSYVDSNKTRPLLTDNGGDIGEDDELSIPPSLLQIQLSSDTVWFTQEVPISPDSLSSSTLFLCFSRGYYRV
jgi:hypothetical protein